jgi:hypothetical protein
MSNKKLKQWELKTLLLSTISATMSFILALHMMWYAIHDEPTQAIWIAVASVCSIIASGLTDSLFESISEELSDREIPCIYDILFG